MFSKAIRYKDCQVKAGLNGMEITCRNLVKKMSFEDFAAWMYPLIDEAAKPLDKPAN